MLTCTQNTSGSLHEKKKQQLLVGIAGQIGEELLIPYYKLPALCLLTFIITNQFLKVFRRKNSKKQLIWGSHNGVIGTASILR